MYRILCVILNQVFVKYCTQYFIMYSSILYTILYTVTTFVNNDIVHNIFDILYILYILYKLQYIVHFGQCCTMLSNIVHNIDELKFGRFAVTGSVRDHPGAGDRNGRTGGPRHWPESRLASVGITLSPAYSESDSGPGPGRPAARGPRSLCGVTVSDIRRAYRALPAARAHCHESRGLAWERARVRACMLPIAAFN